MQRATRSSIDSVKQQSRALKNTYIFVGAALMVASISLATFMSLGHIIFEEEQPGASNVKAELDFNSIDKNTPVPLLMSSEKLTSENVRVLGAEITNDQAPGIDISPPSTLLRDTYIRSFTFVRTQESDSISMISASWNSRKSSSPQLYIIRQSLDGSLTDKDFEIYSIEGTGYEVSSHTFEADTNDGNLYLSIYELDNKGAYQLKDESLLVQSSN